MMDITHWWHDPLAKDMHHALRQKESLLPTFLAQSPQLSSRRCLVDWVAIICDKHQLCPTARHLAIMLLDFFMDKFDIIDEQLRLVALGCLLVAAKFEEQEIKIPKVSVLNTHTTRGYLAYDYRQMELTLLDFFQWHIGLPTAAHFIDYFLTSAVTCNDLLYNGPMLDIVKAAEFLGKYTDYFLEISLQDHVYREYKPSQVAASCIASARMCLSITPPWSLELQRLTGYHWSDINRLVTIMLKTHQLDEQAARVTKNDSSCSPGSLPSTPHTPESVISTSGSVSSENMETVVLLTPSSTPYTVELRNGGFIINAISM